MKKRIVSMILALSMVLSILPVSAFADAGAGFSSAAAEETNSITYSSQSDYEDVGTNAETQNQVVKIKIGTNGLPKAASGTGWSFDETTGLTITGTGSEDTEYILDGTVSCNVTVKNANSYTVYLLDGTVTGTLLIEASYMRGVYVLGGSYADVQLNLGTIDGGTYDKLTENGGNVRGGFFRDISGLKPDTQQQAHQLLLPKNCTLNGQKETKIYIIKKYNYSGDGNDLELVVESDIGCGAWAVASTGGSVMALPAGTTDYRFTYGGMTIATVSISTYGKTLSASFSALPLSDNAPMELVQILSVNKELSFTSEGLPDLTGMTYVDSLDTDANLHRVYMGNGWAYNCYPNDSRNQNIVQILDQGGREINFKDLSPAPISCAVQVTNATITNADFGQTGTLVLTSGKITSGTYHNANVGINSTNGNGTVEITGGTFDSLYCNGSCSIANAVIQSVDFSTYGNNTYTISDTVLGELPDGIQKLLADGQRLSTLVVRNGNVTAMNGRTLPLSTNTIYLVGAGSAELTLNTDVLSINDAPVENYNANTSANGKVLRITGKNDGAEIFVNKSTDPSDLKPLRITEDGLPDLTGVTGVPVSGEGMTANLYEGLGWKYATMEENGRTRAALYITTPDGNPVDLSSDTINPYHKAIAVEQITFANVTVTGIVAEGSVGAENTIIQDGTFQKDVYMDENSTIAGGTFQDVVRAYGKITGGAFNAEVQLNQNSEVTGGVFHDVQLPNYASEKTVIQNAVILGSLTGNNSEVAVSNTVSCGYIESKYLAAGQQQSKLMITDGTVEAVNGNAVAADAVYLVGKTAVTLTFSTKVTNINGEDVSAYNGAQLSADGKTLTLTAKNDGEPIVVNMATTGKLPFSSLSKSDFTISGTTIGPQTVTSSKEGVGKLSLVYVRTYDDRVFETYPAGADMYGLYKQRIVAQEGDKYTDGSLDIGEVVRKYQPKLDDFAYDPQTQTAAYKGQMYFEDAPQYSIQYVAEDGSFPSVTKPTKAGTYSVYIVVNDSDHYDGIQYKVDTYTVAESKYTLTVDDKSTEHVAGEKLSFTAAEKDGYTFTGWKVTGLPTDVDTTKATISFTMPANNVTLKAQYTENAPKTYELKVTNAKVTLKDGGAVADLTAVRVGTELVATAAEKDGYTFTGWEVTGLPADVDTTKATISFTMPANKVTLKAQYKKNNYTLTVDGVDEQRNFEENVTVTAQPVEGKTFTGWEVTGLPADVDTTKATISFKMPANNVTLKAQYTENAPKTYKLDVSDAKVTLKDGSDVADLTAVRVGTELVATAPEKDGYTFTGWEVTGLPADVDTTKVTISFKMPANNVTLKAQYKKNTYTLTVDGVDEQRDFEENVTVTAQPVEGKTFTGWEVTGLPADVDTTKATISFTMPANNVTLKAQYTENVPEKYTVTMGDETTEYAVGADVTIIAPAKAGETFTGWDAVGVPKGTDTNSETITFKMPANNVTLTPQYEKNTYTLTVDGKDEQRTFDEEVTVTAPKKDGYTFTGWEVTGLPTDVDTTKATISFTMPANKVTLKAQYTENVPEKYTVTMGDETTEYAVGADVTIIAPAKAGETFTGWDAVGVPKGTDTNSETITFKMPANNVTLTPQYEKNTYTLTVDGKDEQRTFDEEVTVTAPKKDGYTFTGWEVTGLPTDVDTTKATISFTMPANKVTLKAQYTENVPEKYTVTMGDETTEYAVGADVTIIAPAKAGETFTGWDAVGVPEGTDTNSETITFKMPKNNVTLTPQYKKDSTPTPAPGGDSDGGGAAIVAVAAVGGAAIGVGAYIAGTTAYLKSVLPEGMAIPANRQQLAVALWTAAGKPATQSTALFNDVAADAAELQAIRWVVDTGLMSAQDGSFKPGSRVGRMEVIRTWKTYQQRG